MDERTLTDADVAAIASAVQRAQTCAVGITHDDAAELREFVSWLKKLKSTIGTVVIYGFVAVLGILFYMGVGRWK